MSMVTTNNNGLGHDQYTLNITQVKKWKGGLVMVNWIDTTVLGFFKKKKSVIVKTNSSLNNGNYVNYVVWFNP